MKTGAYDPDPKVARASSRMKDSKKNKTKPSRPNRKKSSMFDPFISFFTDWGKKIPSSKEEKGLEIRVEPNDDSHVSEDSAND
eukprot:CAMPEP_0114520628 /NCGR_PEP_ID=MMETSP0109-20121206/19711_1 /TAXON_ID=29199 /ORGANISM="Chlorarachnion reptans, Strain CCCM449" /LENGTH=82 /DNA_ID=CAMNT_0001701593 /DNA_START=39 /DNA_END=284 /DNA_ORIENTATION=+